MSAFPGAGARVFYNEEGEPLGWDYPDAYGPDPGDPYGDDDRDLARYQGDDEGDDEVEEEAT